MVDIWGLSWGPRDYWLENRLKSRLVERLGRKTKVFVFLTSFLEAEGWFPRVRCPPSIFPFRKVDFAGLFLEEEDPWVSCQNWRLRVRSLITTSFLWALFFGLGLVDWAFWLSIRESRTLCLDPHFPYLVGFFLCGDGEVALHCFCS